MKIAFTSDLHYDYSDANKKIVQHLVKQIEAEKPDILIIGGDIADKTETLDYVLSMFKTMLIPKLFIPGNHDIWIEPPLQNNSFIKYKFTLNEICRKNNFIYITESFYVADDVAFIGSIGWYDYTFKRDYLEYSEQDYDRGIFSIGFNHDCNHIKWVPLENISTRDKPLNNKNIFEYVFKEFKKQLFTIADKYDTLVIVLHTVPFIECLEIYNKVPEHPFIAYEGSRRLGELISQIDSPKKVIILHGHSHDNYLDIRKDNLTIRCNPLGEYEDIANTDLESVVQRSYGIVIIEKGQSNRI